MRAGLTPSAVQWCRCGGFRGPDLAESVPVRRRFRAGVGVFCQTLASFPIIRARNGPQSSTWCRSRPACLERAPDTQRGRRKLYTPAYPYRLRSSTNANRGLNSRHDGQPYVDSTTSVDGARTMPRHNAGSSSPQDRASTRIPISTAPSGSSGNTGPCISQTQEGDLRPRLLLASTRLSTRSTTRYQPGFLGQETRPEHPAGYRQRESAPTARVDNSHSLGMRNQAHGRDGMANQRISRHEAIEIDRSGSKCNGSYPDYVISSRWR